MSRTVLVTGANGFIGRSFCTRGISLGWEIRGLVRSSSAASLLPVGVTPMVIDRWGSPQTPWKDILKGVDAVIHLAGLAHKFHQRMDLSGYRDVNVALTRSLALACAQYGVRRLVYLSSVSVYGRRAGKKPLDERDTLDPQDTYGVSKWEAELILNQVARTTGLEVAILRPPLVYGRGAPGNFSRLLSWIRSGVPLPLGGINNARQYLGIDNLTDGILACVVHPRAAGETFLISDEEAISTSSLVRLIAAKMNKKMVLFSVHPVILIRLCQWVGKTREWEKLSGDLLIETHKIREELGWVPRIPLEEGIRRAVV